MFPVCCVPVLLFLFLFLFVLLAAGARARFVDRSLLPYFGTSLFFFSFCLGLDTRALESRPHAVVAGWGCQRWR